MAKHTGSFPSLVAVRVVNILVFGLILRTHIPVEAIFQAWCIILIFYPLELLGATQGTSRLDKVGLGFRNKPVW